MYYTFRLEIFCPQFMCDDHWIYSHWWRNPSRDTHFPSYGRRPLPKPKFQLINRITGLCKCELLTSLGITIWKGVFVLACLFNCPGYWISNPRGPLRDGTMIEFPYLQRPFKVVNLTCIPLNNWWNIWSGCLEDTQAWRLDSLINWDCLHTQNIFVLL